MALQQLTDLLFGTSRVILTYAKIHQRQVFMGPDVRQDDGDVLSELDRGTEIDRGGFADVFLGWCCIKRRHQRFAD